MLQLKKYSRWKINIQSIFGQHKILYLKITKKIGFRNTLNHFIFQKFIPRIYDVVHYKHFFRDHNNLVIMKKRKKLKKNIFRNHLKTSSSFQKFNHHIKSKRRSH
jgi:hypothetical protein